MAEDDAGGGADDASLGCARNGGGHVLRLHLVSPTWLANLAAAIASTADVTKVLDADCLQHILSRLGLPSLLACRSVCKALSLAATRFLQDAEWRSERLRLDHVGHIGQSEPCDACDPTTVMRCDGITQLLARTSMWQGPFDRGEGWALVPSRGPVDWDCQIDRLHHSRCLKIEGLKCHAPSDDGRHLLVVTSRPLVGDRMAQVRDARTGELLHAFGERADRRLGSGWREGELKQPVAAVWVGDEVYIADEGRHQLVIFCAPRGVQETRELRAFGSGGTGPNPYQQFEQAGPILHSPCALAVWQNRLFVVDRVHRRIFVLSRGTGRLLTSWPYTPACNAQLAQLCRQLFLPTFDEARASVCAGQFGVLLNAGTTSEGETKVAHFTHSGVLLAEYLVVTRAAIGMRLELSTGPHLLGRNGGAIYCTRICPKELWRRAGMDSNTPTGVPLPWVAEELLPENDQSCGRVTVLEFKA